MRKIKVINLSDYRISTKQWINSNPTIHLKKTVTEVVIEALQEFINK